MKEITVEKAISKYIEFYNKAKNNNNKYPVHYAAHKLDEWLHYRKKQNEEAVCIQSTLQN